MTEDQHADALADQLSTADELTLSRSDLDLCAKALRHLAVKLRKQAAATKIADLNRGRGKASPA